MISPIDVATSGYLNTPLAIAADGYIYEATVVIRSDDPETGGGSSRTIQGKSVDLIKQQMREDEEIIQIVLVAIQQGII